MHWYSGVGQGELGAQPRHGVALLQAALTPASPAVWNAAKATAAAASESTARVVTRCFIREQGLRTQFGLHTGIEIDEVARDHGFALGADPGLAGDVADPARRDNHQGCRERPRCQMGADIGGPGLSAWHSIRAQTWVRN